MMAATLSEIGCGSVPPKTTVFRFEALEALYVRRAVASE